LPTWPLASKREKIQSEGQIGARELQISFQSSSKFRIVAKLLLERQPFLRRQMQIVGQWTVLWSGNLVGFVAFLARFSFYPLARLGANAEERQRGRRKKYLSLNLAPMATCWGQDWAAISPRSFAAKGAKRRRKLMQQR